MSTPEASVASVCPDTTTGSLLHWLVGRRSARAQQLHLTRIYLISAVVAYLPLLVAATWADLPLWHEPQNGKLTFLHDWGLAYGLLVSFPTLLLMFLTDQNILDRSLAQVARDGVIALSTSEATSLTETWTPYFRRSNVVSQLVGILCGLGLGLGTMSTYVAAANSWIAPDGRIGVVSWAYAYGISLLYAIVIIYVWRSVTVARFLRALVAVTPLRLLPFHPDKCGGLRPVGRLGLRNQYTLSVLGINIVLLVLVWKFEQGMEESVRTILILAVLAYLTLGPLIFMAPLLPFRDGMLRAKEDWSSQVAGLLRRQFALLRDKISSGEITSTDEAAIDRLRKLGSVIDELPVWPFDSQTIRKFATAYVVPLILPLLGKLLLSAIGY